MRSFRFEENNAENSELEYALRYRKRKMAKQQLIFSAILITAGILLAIYMYDKMMYTELDGYVTNEVNKQRADEDLYVKDIYVNVGSVVMPGDTLYSYIYMSPVFDQINVNTEPDVVVRGRDMDLKYAALMEEIKVLRVRIADLQKQIAVENHNIGFGLSSSSHKMDLQRELNEDREDLQAKMATLATIGKARAVLRENISHSSYSRNEQQSFNSIIENASHGMHSQIKYRIATDSAVVTQIYCAEGTCMFHAEEIMDILPVNIKRSNVSVWAYVPTDKVSKVKKSRRLEVLLGDEVKLKGSVGMIGVRTEDLPEHLRSNFARQGRVIIAQILVDKGQTIPLWCLADELPVRIRFANITLNRKEGYSQDTTILRFHTGDGLSEKSLPYFNKIRKSPNNKRHSK